jgi:hypothetical protein
MSENLFENLIAKETGLPEKAVVDGSKDLFANLMYKETGDANVFAPTKSTPRVGFSGLDLNASTISLTNTYTDPLESYTSYGVPRNAFIDWNETRAQNQTTVQKWAHGLTKAGITALGAVTENTIGVAGGLLNLAFGENHSYYDNPVGRTIDEVNEWAREAMPNYYTKREEEMGVLEGMTTANFWADKFANGAGYTLGSLATAWTGVGEGALIAKLAGMGRMAKIGKAADKVMDVTQDAAKFGSKQFQAYNAAKAIKAPYSPNFAKGIDEGLTAMAKKANINTAAKQLSVGMHMSLAEASVEAREAKNKFIEEQTAKWKEANPGQEMSADMEDGIISSANAVGNMTFGVNLPLLTLTNILSFGNMFLGGKPTAEALNNGIKKVGDKWVSSIPEKGMAKAFSKANRIFGAPIRNSVSEGAQEAGQFITAATAEDYYSDKFADGVGDMAEAFVNGLSKSIGTKEGLESILIGALVGGGSGAISALGGADRKFAKAKDANTQKALDIMNSEAFGKVLENMEQSQKNIGYVGKINKANEDGDFKKAELYRRRLISSVADQYRKAGALDYAMEQMDDLKQLSEEEFKKRWNYDANRTLKEQTGMEQSELIDDVKGKMERSIKRQEQVQTIVRAQNPSMGMFSKILDSFDSEELKKSKALENSIRTMYANTLLHRLEDVDTHDDLIKKAYKELHDIAPALAEIPEEDFEYMVKTGKIKIDEKGDVTVSGETTTALNPKLAAKISEIFAAKEALNPEDAKQFDNKARELGVLIRDRQSAIQSYQGLRDKPENIALLVEAEVEKRKQDDKYKNKQQAQAAIANSQSVEELDKAFPKNASPEDIAAAMAKREELLAQENSLMSTYEAMSKDEFDAIDAENLSPLEESAYNRVKAKRAEKEAEENAKKDIGIPSPTENELAKQAADQVLSDIEARTFGEIMVNPDGNTVTINGRIYSNLEDNPLDALLRNEQGTIVGVRMTDMATGNEVTWKSVDLADSANPEVTERENAIAEGLAYMTLLKAASIRSDRSTPISEAKEELAPRVQAIKEDAEVRDKFEENTESTEDERELAKNNLTKTAGLTDDQLRAQIETLKSDLEEVNQLITIEEQIAREAGFTKKEFDQDPQTKELRAIKKRITQLLTNKIKTLRDRKQTKREEALETTETTAEVENVLSPSEEDLIITGLGEEIKKFEDEVAKLNESAQSYQDLIDGKYGEGQDVAAAAVSLKEVKKKIAVVKAKITKRRNKINSINEERELEKLRQDRDAAEGAGLAPEGQEPEGKDITPGEGTPAEGVDGILSEEQVKALRQQREEAERLRKLEEEKKKAQNPSAGPEVLQQPIVISKSGELDVRLAKGEKERLNNKVLVASEGEAAGKSSAANTEILQTSTEGEILLVNPALSSNPLVAPEGAEVRFEVREDTNWWQSQIASIPTNEREEWMKTTGWKTVPIYMIVTDQEGVEQRVSLLQSTAEDSGKMRKDIYELYKKGLTPVATSAGKIYNSSNYSNARLVDGTPFFYPASTLVNKGETPAIAIVGVYDSQKSWVLRTEGNSTLSDLYNSTLNAKVEDETKGTKLTYGQVGIVVADPNGAPKIVMASTRDMTESGRTAALSHITADTPSLAKFGEIVGTNLLLNDAVDPSLGENVTTEIDQEMNKEYSENAKNFMLIETLANGNELITFFSPSADSLVRVSAENLKLILEGVPTSFSFIEVGLNEKGYPALKTASKDNSVREAVSKELANEFRAAIMNKKFQVSKFMLNSKETYVSPITGETYSSYFEYLSSEKEVVEDRAEGKGTKAILGVDTEVNSQKSPFFDVGIKTKNLGTREKNVIAEQELEINQVVSFSDNRPVQYSITETPSTPLGQVEEPQTYQELSESEKFDLGAYIVNLQTLNNGDMEKSVFRWLEAVKEQDPTLSRGSFNNMLDQVLTNKFIKKDADGVIEYTRDLGNKWFDTIEKTTDTITDEVYNNFVDKNTVPDSIMQSIANKVINRAPLSQRETAIFSGKTSEINEIIRKKANVAPSPAANIEAKIREVAANKDFIELSADKTYYINKKTGKTYKRVSDVISEEKPDPNNELVQSSLEIGSKVDVLVRDFFAGQLKDLASYDVSNVDTIKAFLRSLETVQENLRKRQETVLANDIVLYNDELGLAGTVDLLTYDKDGNIRIYDMKTMRGDNFTEYYKGDAFNKYESTRYGKSKKQKHTEQISLYRIMLNNTHGLLAKTIGVMPLEINYAAGDVTTSKLNLLKGVQLSPLDSVEGPDGTVYGLSGITKPAVTQPKVSSEEKVVIVSGAEDTSGIFDLSDDISDFGEDQPAEAIEDLGDLLSMYKVAKDFVPPGGVPDAASQAQSNPEQAENDENNCLF